MDVITELDRTIYMLMAHPDNEPNSEFADRIDSLIDVKEQLDVPVVLFTEAELKAKLEEQLEETRQWLIAEDFEGLAERL